MAQFITFMAHGYIYFPLLSFAYTLSSSVLAFPSLFSSVLRSVSLFIVLRSHPILLCPVPFFLCLSLSSPVLNCPPLSLTVLHCPSPFYSHLFLHCPLFSCPFPLSAVPRSHHHCPGPPLSSLSLLVSPSAVFSIVLSVRVLSCLILSLTDLTFRSLSSF